ASAPAAVCIRPAARAVQRRLALMLPVFDRAVRVARAGARLRRRQIVELAASEDFGGRALEADGERRAAVATPIGARAAALAWRRSARGKREQGGGKCKLLHGVTSTRTSSLHAAPRTMRGHASCPDSQTAR